MTESQVPVFYSDAYVVAEHAFDTTRKARWVADSLRDRTIPGIVLQEPEPLAESGIDAVHDRACVAAVRTGSPRELAQPNGFPWSRSLWTRTLASPDPPSRCSG